MEILARGNPKQATFRRWKHLYFLPLAFLARSLISRRAASRAAARTSGFSLRFLASTSRDAPTNERVNADLFTRLVLRVVLASLSCVRMERKEEINERVSHETTYRPRRAPREGLFVEGGYALVAAFDSTYLLVRLAVRRRPRQLCRLLLLVEHLLALAVQEQESTLCTQNTRARHTVSLPRVFTSQSASARARARRPSRAKP